MINENTIHEESSSSFPKGLEEFRQNIKNKDNSSDIYCHNLYLLQTTDRDGNVTGEAYGMNLMTNWGFKNIYTSTSSYETNCKIYIGNGTDEPVLTNNALYSPIITTGSTNVNTSYSIYPFQYDSSTGIITGIQRIYQGYFDYNISGITENFEITEIGYGTSTTQLVSHARIYDSEGNPSSITKRINERLTINVFWTLNMKESIIQSNYENGVYIVMRPAFSGLLTKTYSRTLYTIYGSQKIGCTESYSNNMYYNVATLLDDNNVKSTIKPNSLLIENQRSYISDIVAVDQRRSNNKSTYVENITGEFYFMIMTKDKLPTPEEITTYDAYTNNPLDNRFSNLFGLSYNSASVKGELPCTNFNITSLSMYNHLTKEWDIEETYLNDSNTEYDNVWRSFVRIYTTLNNVDCPVWVYVNTRTDLPITSFNNSNIVLYATDKYWDTSTWVLISNIGNVDESLQCKRYYIRTTETTESAKYILYPQRNMVYHQLTSVRDKYVINNVNIKNLVDLLPKNSGMTDRLTTHLTALSSETYGWILMGSQLIYLHDTDKPVYELTGPYDRRFDIFNQWTTEDTIILTNDAYISSKNISVRVYNTTDSSVTPTYTDIELLFSNITNVYFDKSDVIYSFSNIGPGFLVCQRDDDVINECLILNIHGSDGNTVTQSLLSNVKFCKVIYGTSNCVYLKTDTSGIVFEIYDMLNQTTLETFQLPNYDYSIIGLTAWKNVIYITTTLSETTVSFIYIIDKQTLKQLSFVVPIETSQIPNGSTSRDTIVGYSDECLVISSDSNSITYIIENSDPMTPIQWNKSLTSINLKHVNDNKQLVMLYTTYYSRYINGYYGDRSYCMNIIDIGYVIDNRKILDPHLEHYICASATEMISYRWCTSCLAGTIFDGGVAYSSFSEYSSIPAIYNNPLTWVDMPNVLPHKMTGTTTTIQAWNNPKRLQNKEYSFTLTNDTTNWGDGTNV